MTESSSFEKSMLKLEEIVKKLESGELSLEDSLKHYEQGIQLTHRCQQALAQAEQKVETLRVNTPANDCVHDE